MKKFFILAVVAFGMFGVMLLGAGTYDLFSSEVSSGNEDHENAN